MTGKEIKTLIVDSFFVIFGSAMIGAHLFALFAEVGPLHFLHFIVLFVAALLISISNFVFYSKGDLPVPQMMVRYLLHFFITIGIAIAAGTYLQWFNCLYPWRVVTYLVIVVVLYGLMIGVNELRYRKSLDEVNAYLKSRSGL